jgi:hypothetical protein
MHFQVFWLLFILTMASNIPTIATFDDTVGDQDPGPVWDRWFRRFENYLAALSIKDDSRKRSMLLHFIGQDSFEAFETLPDTGDNYATAASKL